MQRLRQQRIVLARLLRHEGLNPNRALNALYMQMYLDADPGKEKDLIAAVLLAQCGVPKRMKWTDEDDPVVGDPGTKEEIEATNAIRDVYASIFSRKEESEDAGS